MNLKTKSHILLKTEKSVPNKIKNNMEAKYTITTAEFTELVRTKIRTFKIITGSHPNFMIISTSFFTQPDIVKTGPTGSIKASISTTDPSYIILPQYDKSAVPQYQAEWHLLDLKVYITNLPGILEVY